MKQLRNNVLITFIKKLLQHPRNYLLLGLIILVLSLGFLNIFSPTKPDSPLLQEMRVCYERAANTSQENSCIRRFTAETVMPSSRLSGNALGDALVTHLRGHPLALGSYTIAEFDPLVASYIVGIGKIESNWGKRAPYKDGVDCFNYWGYGSSGGRGKIGGLACFASLEEAVRTVGLRIGKFVASRGASGTALLVWKCGASCASHDPVGVERWVGVVDRYSAQVRNLQTRPQRELRH